MYKEPKIAKLGTQNTSYGYPQGQKRRIRPSVLMVVHITGNPDTAAMPEGITPGTGTYQEWKYVSSANYKQNSAHMFVARDGNVIELFDAYDYAAWNNGDLKEPETSWPAIKRIVSQPQNNPNEFCLREVECTGSTGNYELTAEQMETVAWISAKDSIQTGFPIIRGDTVLTHADFNSVDRANCAFKASTREARLARLCGRAAEIRQQLLDDQSYAAHAKELAAQAEAFNTKLAELTQDYEQKLALGVAALTAEKIAHESDVTRLEIEKLQAIKSTTTSIKDRVRANVLSEASEKADVYLEGI